MVSHCPHCEKELRLNDAQQQKIHSALEALKSGNALRLGCPHCKKPIALNKDGSLRNEEIGLAPRPVAVASVPHSKPVAVEPPGSPDISWLVSGIYTDDDVVADVQKVLVLLPEGPARQVVEKAFQERGYQAEFPESADDARAQMRFVSFTAVVLHTDFDGDITTSSFHRYMQEMPMSKRRSIYYVLVGKAFHTLYDLEALTYSANVVVNDSEIEHIDVILKKGLQEYNELFGPYLEALATFDS